MRVLLDSCTFWWLMTDAPELSARARALCRDPSIHALHRDPFDRMLVCQAISQGLTLLTPDPLIRQYPVMTEW